MINYILTQNRTGETRGLTRRLRRFVFMKGYQFLENNFFQLCHDRNIKGSSMLLYIFLRGLYSYKQNPIVEYSTKEIITKLGMSRNTISKARIALQRHGVILYTPAKGGCYKAKYTMLGSVLLPSLYKPSCSETAQPAAQKEAAAYNKLTKTKKRKPVKCAHFLPNNRMLVRSL